VLVGSNAEKVVRFASCPVLTVHENAGKFTLKNVALAVNFEDTRASFMNKLKELQQLFGFTLHIVHINTPLNFTTTYAIEEKMHKLSKKYELKNYTFTIINDYSNEEGIIRFADKTNADMIVMLTHGRKGLSYFLDGSTTSQVVNHARKPIMSFKING
jgi:nucleotide-binding universal stress UspA family protein